MNAPSFNGVKVFSATMMRDRENLGERVTEWLATGKRKIVDVVVTQSSDEAFHMLAITVFYNEPERAPINGLVRIPPDDRTTLPKNISTPTATRRLSFREEP